MAEKVEIKDEEGLINFLSEHAGKGQMLFEATFWPSAAQASLDLKNSGNRKQKPGNIKTYAEIMLAGEWRLADTISFDIEGNMDNGQNRMAAVVLANIPAEFNLIINQALDAKEVIDTGATRSAADAVTMAGDYEGPAGNMATFMKLVINYKRGTLDVYHPKKITNAELGQYIRSSDMELIKLADKDSNKLYNSLQKSNKSALGALAYLAYEMNTEKAEEFISKLISPTELPEGSPILAISAKLAVKKKDPLMSRNGFHLALYLKAWMAFINNDSLYRLNYFPSKEPYPALPNLNTEE